MTLREEFDTELPREGLSSMKWEYEKERTGFDDILSYGTADMDFKSPEPVRKAICRVAEKGHLGYPYVPDSYYSAVENWLYRTTGWKIDGRQSISNHVDQTYKADVDLQSPQSGREGLDKRRAD